MYSGILMLLIFWSRQHCSEHKCRNSEWQSFLCFFCMSERETKSHFEADKVFCLLAAAINWQLADHFIYSSVLLHSFLRVNKKKWDEKEKEKHKKCGKLKWKSNFLQPHTHSTAQLRKLYKRSRKKISISILTIRRLLSSKVPSEKRKLHFLHLRKLMTLFTREFFFLLLLPPLAR